MTDPKDAEIEALKAGYIEALNSKDRTINKMARLTLENSAFKTKLEIAIHSISLAIGKFLGDDNKAFDLETALQKIQGEKAGE